MNQRLLVASLLLYLSCASKNANNLRDGGGTGGAAAGGGAGGAVDSSQSVLERNKHPSRDGHFVQPTLTKAAAATMAPDTGFAPTLAGSADAAGNAMWASPLYLENGPAGKGVFFAVTTGNDVYALDETDGHVVWTKNIGSSPTANGVSCGSIHPLGIISTPVIDEPARTIYVAGAIGTTSISRHEIHALSVDDGTERTGWPVDVSQISTMITQPDGSQTSLAFTPPPHNQRSALSLVAGTLYVAYGGHVGDCGAYHGWVIGIHTQNPTQRGAWATGGQGEGIWAAGGMASDGTGVFAMTGNHTPRNQDATRVDSEEVVRITGLGTLTRTNQNFYYPAVWSGMDAGDADLGANNPVYIEIPGAVPATLVAAVSKDGHLYLLDSKNLGGPGGQAVDFPVASGGMSIHSAPASYTTAQGRYVVFSTDGGATCPAGGPSGKVIMSVLIPAGAPPAPRVAWCAALAGLTTAPVATTTDGKANPVVWFMNNGKLNGVDGDTGQSLFAGGTGSCANVRQWTSPIAVKGHLVTAADGRLCSWSPH
jgi:hypothetical protein